MSRSRFVQIDGAAWDAIFGQTVEAVEPPKPNHKPRRKRNHEPMPDRFTLLKPPPKAGETPQPGAYVNVSFDEYVAWDAMNATTLLNGLRSMAHLRSAMLADDDDKSDAMTLGSLLHSGCFEPHTVMEQFAVLPAFEYEIRRPDGTEYANVRGTKAYREAVAEFMDENPDKIIVEQSEFDAMYAMLTALSANERSREYLDNAGPAEISIVWNDPGTGRLCKARIDKLDFQNQRIVDLKTTRDASRFESFIGDYSYHVRAAFYADGLETLTGRQFEFAITAVETSAPYAVRSAPLSFDAVEAGRREYRRLLDALAVCETSDEWPGYEDPAEWNLPAWKQSEPLALNVAGETVTL